MEIKANSILDNTIEKIKNLVNADTVMGTPIVCGETTIIPVSKVNYGFGSGGSDFDSKKENNNLFGGGGGAGVTITPIAFLSVNNGNVKLLQISPVSSTADRAVEMIPDIVDKVATIIKKDKKVQADDSLDLFDEEDFFAIK